jgi:sodium/bile acid cotransporter 7
MLAWLSRIDLMIRLLAVAILLAFIVPATGDARVVAQRVADGAIFVLFLLNGLRIDRREVVRGLANLRFLVPLTLWVFGVMALAGWGAWLATASWLDPSLALGFLFLGILPSTVQSATSYTSLARGNVALAVIAAAVLNIVGVFVSAPLFATLAGAAGGEIGVDAIGRIALILILPFAIGQVLQVRLRDWIARRRSKVVLIDRGVIAMAVYVAVSGSVEQNVWARLDGASWALLAVALTLFLLFGHVGAWIASAATRLPRPDRIAFMFAGGQKSVAIGVPLGAILFPPEVAGLVLVPLLIYHLAQLVIAAPLATRLAAPRD